MPAKKKPAPKAPARTAKKPAVKASAKPAKKAPAKPVKKVSARAPAKPAKKAAARPAPKKSPPPVKKSPSKPAAKKPAQKAAKTAAPAKSKKPAVSKTPAAKKPAAPVKKAPPAAKAPVKKTPPAKEAKPAAAKPVQNKETTAKKPKGLTNGAKIITVKRDTSSIDDGITLVEPPKKPVLPAAFLKKQKQRLVELRDAYMNAAEGVAAESLRNHESGDSSAFGMHQADAGSDAYDRDFALSLLAKEQDAIYEINEALNRIARGTYGICEMSGETIPEERLEALPFTRFTVNCQARIERDQRGGRWTRPVRSLFGLDEAADDSEDSDEDDAVTPAKSKSNENNESLDFGKE